MGENSTIGGTRNWADAIDVTQWGNAPETLRALIGACVTVLLTNGSTHAGVLYTADPATGTVMLLEADPDKRSASGTTTLNSLRCRVFLGHSVQGIQARPPPVALQSLDNHSDAVMSSDIPTEMHLFQSHRVMQFAETMLGAKEDSKNHDGQFEVCIAETLVIASHVSLSCVRTDPTVLLHIDWSG